MPLLWRPPPENRRESWRRRHPSSLKKALQIDAARADTWLNLGNLLIEAGQLDDAVECFERASRYDPMMAAARSDE